jgi:hypothetical protein
MSWSHADWCKFCIHLNTLNVHGSGTVTGLKGMVSRSYYMAWSQ